MISSNLESAGAAQGVPPAQARQSGGGVPIRVLVLSTNVAECHEMEKCLRTDKKYAVTHEVVSAHALFRPEHASADITLVCLPRKHRLSESGKQGSILSQTHPIIFVTHNCDDQTRLWAFQNGAADVLVRPFSTSELMFRIERLAASLPEICHGCGEETVMLSFLGQVLQDGLTSIEPVLEPMARCGHFYPDVARIAGHKCHAPRLLDLLVSEGILETRVANRIHLCPVCREHYLNYRETCAKCASMNIGREQMVHHFACAHVGPMELFRKGGKLVCPKCDKTLRHIGLDYEKPTSSFLCRDCDHVFSEPAIQANCLFCGTVCDPAKTLEKVIHRFIVTPLAEVAVQEQRIGGINLSSILKNQITGLYTRQFLEHQIMREIYGAARYKIPFAFLLVRIEALKQVITEHSADAEMYVTSVIKAVGEGLRTLDVACVWGTDLWAVLLTNTGREGALKVARRMNEHVEGLEFLRFIHKPSIRISLVSSEVGYTTVEEVIQAALDGLQ